MGTVPPSETRSWTHASRWAPVVILAAIPVGFVLWINYMYSPSRIQRPAGLASTAILVGTPEHYDFIDCHLRDAGVYDCTMFGASGAPYATGRFRGAGNADLRDAGLYWFDGSTVRLSGGRALEPVEPVRFLDGRGASSARAN
jgi:hypothetical protein